MTCHSSLSLFSADRIDARWRLFPTEPDGANYDGGVRSAHPEDRRTVKKSFSTSALNSACFLALEVDDDGYRNLAGFMEACTEE